MAISCEYRLADDRDALDLDQRGRVPQPRHADRCHCRVPRSGKPAPHGAKFPAVTAVVGQLGFKRSQSFASKLASDAVVEDQDRRSITRYILRRHYFYG